MKTIPLSNSAEVALVDDCDFEEFSKSSWWVDKDGYAFTGSFRYGTRRTMHDMVIKVPVGMLPDHKDRNKLNNQRENLRVATRSQNGANSIIHRVGNKSGYKGVSFFKSSGKWRAQIKVSGVKIHLGYFEDKISAAKAYDESAKRNFGEFANTNFK